MSNFYGGFGQGQKVIKREDTQHEANLPVRQARIGAKAAFFLVVLGFAAVLLIGEALLIGGGALLIMRLMVQVIRWEPPYSVSNPKAVKTAMLGTLTGALAFWLWLVGPLAAERYWPGLRFRKNVMFVGDRALFTVAPWVRILAFAAICAVAAWQLLIIYRMKTEILDPNWPPTYGQRDPDLGPWDPTLGNVGFVEAEGETVRQRPDALRLEIAKPNGLEMHDLPASKAALREIARAVEGTGRHWSRRDVEGLADLSKDRADALLSAMEAAGLLYYPGGRNHPSGASLTEEGRAFVDKLTS